MKINIGVSDTEVWRIFQADRGEEDWLMVIYIVIGLYTEIHVHPTRT
jgi:hypothetical protein